MRAAGRPAVVGPGHLPAARPNALDTADRIKATMRELETRFPAGLKYAIVYDTTPFVRESVDEVFKTLRDAIILVAIVVLLFLQDWKALLLPLIDVRVSLIGTFAVMSLMGFTLNNLTLFGLVLAIGIVVDDAIVVLENIERWLDKGLPVREATIKAMDEITGPIIAITLVLSSVFLPSAFLGGITGQFFRQFALTISASMIISAINAMTMTPARAASIFAGRKPGKHGDEGKEALPWWSFALFGGLATVWLLTPILGAWLGLPAGEGHGEAAPGGLKPACCRGDDLVLFLPGAVAGGVLGWFMVRPVNWVLGWFFRGFNWVFDRATRVYGAVVGWCLRLSAIVLVVYVGLLGLTGFGFTRVPTGFIPMQDKGYLVTNIQLPDSASLERTLEVTDAVEKIALETPGVAHTLGHPGQSFVLNAISSNFGSMFVILKPFHERRDPALSGDAIAAQLRAALCAGDPGGPRAGLRGAAGRRAGQRRRLQADGRGQRRRRTSTPCRPRRTTWPPRATSSRAWSACSTASAPTRRSSTWTSTATKVKIDGRAAHDVFDTLQVYLGSYYVNDFNRFGRTWQVNVQADAPFRMDAETVKQLKVRNADGDMVPLGTVADVRDSSRAGADHALQHVPGGGDQRRLAARGQHRRRRWRRWRRLAEDLPRNMTTEWTELSYLQKQAGKVEQFRDLRQNPFSAFAVGVVLVFFVLAGLYESWSLPLAVILVVPMCLLSAAGGRGAGGHGHQHLRAGRLRGAGRPGRQERHPDRRVRPRPAARRARRRFDAAVEAARVRLRPIVMTSFAFILGVLPLVIADGAGAEMRRTLGTAVFAGMIGVTLFGLFLTPVFYSVVRWFSERRGGHAPDTATPQSPAEAAAPALRGRVVSIERQGSGETGPQRTHGVPGTSSDRREE